MKKTYLAVAAVAALGLSGAAFAEEGKKPAPMTDSEMDGVTAAGGHGQPDPTRQGQYTARDASGRVTLGSTPSGKGVGQETIPGAPSAPTN
jgi:hypothetical protein